MMKATRDLPPGYVLKKMLDLSSNKAALWMNLAALPLLVVFSWAFTRLMILLRSFNPFSNGLWGFVNSFSGWAWVALPVSVILMLVLHELIHGLFFFLFTRQQPKFSLHASYAFAAAPDWYLPRSQYILVGLSPIIIISILCLVASIFVAQWIILYVLIIASFNAAGSLGDLFVVYWVLKHPSNSLVNDLGDRFSIFSSDNQ